jgi:hypothetical protein
MCALTLLDLTCYRIHRDPYSKPRAGTFDCVDAVLPWRFEEEPLPPPVPPKNDVKEALSRSAAAAAAASAVSLPERVTTPWLLRRVKTPHVTQPTRSQTVPVPTGTPTPAPQKASSTDIIRGSPKPDPPAYHAVPPPPPQHRVHLSEERLAITSSKGPAAAVLQSQHPTIQAQPRTPPKPAAVAHRSASARGETEKQRGLPPPASHPGCPQIRSVRSAPHEESSRRPAASGTRAQPSGLRPTAAIRPERVLPSYHSAEPFPSPAPPPYRVSAEDSYPTSVRSRSLPRSSRTKHGGPTPAYEKKETPPLPPLPLPGHPQLSSSAISRIQAGLKVSKQFGDAILQQELRFATPTSDHHCSRLDPPVPNPRLGRRFLSTSELQSHRKAKLGTDKITPELEARLRTANKSSSSVGRSLGDSRQRTASAHPGRGQDKGSQRARR